MNSDDRAPTRSLWNGYRCAFHPDGNLAVLIARRLVVERFDLVVRGGRRERFEFPIEWTPFLADGFPARLLVPGDGRWIVLAHGDGKACTLDLTDQRAMWVRRGDAILDDVSHLVTIISEPSPSVGLVSRSAGALVLGLETNRISDNRDLADAWRRTWGYRPTAAVWHATTKGLSIGTEDGVVATLGGGGRASARSTHLDAVTSLWTDEGATTLVSSSEDGGVVRRSNASEVPEVFASSSASLVSCAQTAAGDVIACTASGTVLRWPSHRTKTPEVISTSLATSAAIATGGHSRRGLRSGLRSR
ncbi:MAG: hypothetical protein M3O36_11350 [Myxococcota bacterium]|nr:hypothetical protein [Myxococcota bacterium]